jgi:transposase-like protein
MKTLLLSLGAVTAAALLFAAQLGANPQDKAAQDAAGKPAVSATDQAVIDAQLPSYPHMVCPVSGEEMGGEMGEPVNLVRDGRLIRVCCKGCIKKVDKDPATAIAAIDAAVKAEQGPSYPLDTCPISGESMESPVEYVHGTRLVRFCCDDCKAKFVQDTTAAMAKIDAALIAAQVKTYKVDVCPVSGEKLGSMGEPVDVLYGTRLVRLCCGGCKKAVAKKGAEIVAKIDALAAAAK